MISGGKDDSALLDKWFARGPQSALYGGMLWIRSIKLYSDGALGSRGAALLDPYSDDAKNNGLLVSDPKFIEAIAVKALKAGFQVNTHAIGDRGNREAYPVGLRREVDVRATSEHRFDRDVRCAGQGRHAALWRQAPGRSGPLV